MTPLTSIQLIPDETLISKIYWVRGHKVMLDSDLALLYEVETRALKQAVKRNPERFPPHYMFELTREENEVLRSQVVILRRGEHTKYSPYVFTEHGVLMLSSVLKSSRATAMSIRIIDVFVKLREMLLTNAELRLEMEAIKKNVHNQNLNIEVLFSYFDEMGKNENPEPEKKTTIGFQLGENG